MPKFYNFTCTISNFFSITLASYHNNPVIRSLSFMKRSLLPEEKSRALSISPSFKYYILNNDAFNNIFQSIFHPAFETSYSDFILRSDYKQIISDKEKTNCAIKQEFLDNSIDLRLSHCFLHRRLAPKGRAGIHRGGNLLSGSQFPIQVDFRGYSLGDLPIAYFNSGHWLLQGSDFL